MESFKYFSLVGMLIFGTLSSIFSKVVYQTEGEDLNGHAKLFRKPWCACSTFMPRRPASPPLLPAHKRREGRTNSIQRTAMPAAQQLGAHTDRLCCWECRATTSLMFVAMAFCLPIGTALRAQRRRQQRHAAAQDGSAPLLDSHQHGGAPPRASSLCGRARLRPGSAAAPAAGSHERARAQTARTSTPASGASCCSRCQWRST